MEATYEPSTIVMEDGQTHFTTIYGTTCTYNTDQVTTKTCDHEARYSVDGQLTFVASSSLGVLMVTPNRARCALCTIAAVIEKHSEALALMAAGPDSDDCCEGCRTMGNQGACDCSPDGVDPDCEDSEPDVPGCGHWPADCTCACKDCCEPLDCCCCEVG